MENMYLLLQELAKSAEAQNLFVASKELNGIRLFKNSINFSQLQKLYLNYLYNFNSINKDIYIENISKHVLDKEIYWTSYLLYCKEVKVKEEKKDNNRLKLVAGKKIKFPKEVKNG